MADTAAPRPRVFFAGHPNGLKDNVKYAFLEAVERDYGFDACLLSTSHGEDAELRAHNLPVLPLRRCTRENLHEAALLVVDDFPQKLGAAWETLNGIPVLQLWHGIPLKKIGFPEIASAVNMDPPKARWLTACYSGYAAVASTSPWATRTLFSKVFHSAAFPELGLPRNDVLLRIPTRRDLINVDAELYGQLVRHRKAGGKVAVYMPTFRDTGENFLTDAALDLQALSAFCLRNNLLLVAKFHPFVDCEAFRDLPGFILCRSASDIYPLLPLADTLITDYSSVYFDFLLLDRPLLFFPYDLERYMTKNRELFFDYASMTPGPLARTQDQLFALLLETVVHGRDAHAGPRRELRERLFAARDAGAARRWCEYIQQMLPLLSHQS